MNKYIVGFINHNPDINSSCFDTIYAKSLEDLWDILDLRQGITVTNIWQQVNFVLYP